MIGLILVTHGRLAEEFVHAMEHVVGKQTDIATVCIGPHDDMELKRKEIAKAIKLVDSGSGAIILTDLFGGTPSNLAMTFLGPEVEVITGVNLPMLIKLAGQADQSSLIAAARDMREHGRNAIWVASDLLRGEK